jgi:hypothetical protein
LVGSRQRLRGGARPYPQRPGKRTCGAAACTAGVACLAALARSAGPGTGARRLKTADVPADDTGVANATSRGGASAGVPPLLAASEAEISLRDTPGAA